MFTGRWTAMDEIVLDGKILGLKEEIVLLAGIIATASFTIKPLICSVEVNCGWPKS